MSAKPVYSSPIDDKIAALEAQLDKLKQQRIGELQELVRRLQGGTSASASPAAAASSAPATSRAPKTKGKRRRTRRPKISDEEAVAKVLAVVKAAGSAGISGKQISESTGIFYPRAGKIATKHCKKVGKAKWTRYFLK